MIRWQSGLALVLTPDEHAMHGVSFDQQGETLIDSPARA